MCRLVFLEVGFLWWEISTWIFSTSIVPEKLCEKYKTNKKNTPPLEQLDAVGKWDCIVIRASERLILFKYLPFFSLLSHSNRLQLIFLFKPFFFLLYASSKMHVENNGKIKCNAFKDTCPKNKTKREAEKGNKCRQTFIPNWLNEKKKMPHLLVKMRSGCCHRRPGNQMPKGGYKCTKKRNLRSHWR